MGLRQLGGTDGGWLIEPAPLDTTRFGLDVARLTVTRGPADPQSLIEALHQHPSQVLIGRYPAELTWVAAALQASGRDVLPVGGRGDRRPTLVPRKPKLGRLAPQHERTCGQCSGAPG